MEKHIHKCRFPGGMVIKPNGVDELTACHFELKQVFQNVTVEVWQCPVCGNVDISWRRQDDTETVIFNELMED